MIYRADLVQCGITEQGARWMQLHVWLQVPEGEALVLEATLKNSEERWQVESVTHDYFAVYGVDTLRDKPAIMESASLPNIAWCEGSVEFCVAQHPDGDKPTLFFQSTLKF